MEVKLQNLDLNIKKIDFEKIEYEIIQEKNRK